MIARGPVTHLMEKKKYSYDLGDSRTEAVDVGGYPIHRFVHQPSSRYDFGWPLQVVTAGEDTWCKGCERRRTNVPLFAIEFILEGTFDYTQDGVESQVGTGEVFLVRPGCDVDYQYFDERIGRKKVIEITGPLLGPMLSLTQLNKIHHFRPTNADWLTQQYALAERILTKAMPGFMHESSMLAYGLIMSLGRAATQRALPIVVRQAISLMEHRINSNLNMQDLCEYTKTSQPSLHRLFAKHLGEAPINYYISLKIEAAKTNICAPGASIKAVAAELGYDNQQYFSSLFKARVGVSPSQYQRQKKLQGNLSTVSRLPEPADH